MRQDTGQGQTIASIRFGASSLFPKKKNKCFMKRIQVNYRLLLSLLLIPLLSGCIYETRPECPVSHETWLVPSFTKHTNTDDDGSYVDLFAETAKEITVYIFDENGFYIGRTSQDGPFENGLEIPFAVPGPGTYRAILWTNTNPFTQLNIEPQKGTNISELSLSLKNLEQQQTVSYRFDPILYGQTEPFTVTESNGENQEIKLDLIRVTNKVQVLVRWRNKVTGELTAAPLYADRTRIYLEDNNGVLNFENTKCQGPWLTYIPQYFTGEELDPFKDPAFPDATTLAGEFSTMRLFTDSETKLVFNQKDDAGNETPAARFDLMKLIKKTDAYPTQDDLDREEYFHVYIEFAIEEGNGDTYTAMDITINGWHVSNMDDEEV